MARTKSTELTGAEQKIMQVLWQQGPSAVKDIAAVLSQDSPVAYTTVQTLCRILLEKGHVQAQKHGKAFIYQAITVQQEARTQALSSLLKRFFGGSPALLAQHLLTEQHLSPELTAQLQASIDEAVQAADPDPADHIQVDNDPAQHNGH
ncbi:BlaI/MecI/CopY family transcriptional regulator [Rheinheimera riviphila]|uniref:BlaI/MecI/CopY family transcriptional regulator n=1 Tax=Rheinheimera riviphila TaxID=1834037 RepID=A0A437QBV9_9GAMM|nr:BlaI/MecI/CopY family transcriptional regulator [Rheinheimera riviphila]RVU32006.1 BlaI/MecI/CopY family transcriptional regulator [Rheinheimera riviphila]